MNKTTRTTLLLTAVALAASSLFAADRLRAGEWEFTTTTNGDSRTFKHCVTADEATSVNGDTATARAYAEKKSAGNCTITDYKVSGNAVSYAMTCGTRTIQSTATYHGDTSEGDLRTKNGADPEVVTHVKARRLGDCP